MRILEEPKERENFTQKRKIRKEITAKILVICHAIEPEAMSMAEDIWSARETAHQVIIINFLSSSLRKTSPHPSSIVRRNS